MQDRLKSLSLRGIGEDAAAEPATVERTAIIEHLGSEGLDDATQCRTPRRHHFVRDLVGVDDGHAAGREELGHRALAAGDTARERYA
jgi:hypothetical protein